MGGGNLETSAWNTQESEDPKKAMMDKLENSNLDSSLLKSNALKDLIGNIGDFKVSDDGKSIDITGQVHDSPSEFQDDNGLNNKYLYRTRTDSRITKTDNGVVVDSTIRSVGRGFAADRFGEIKDSEERYGISREKTVYNNDGMVAYRSYSMHKSDASASPLKQMSDFDSDSRFKDGGMNESWSGNAVWQQAELAPVVYQEIYTRDPKDPDKVSVDVYDKGTKRHAEGLPVDSRDDHELNVSGRNIGMYDKSFTNIE